MRWQEVVFTVGRDDFERWTDALLEAGALSVRAEDADADSPDEQALFGEPGVPSPAELAWRHTRLAALVAPDADAPAMLAEAAAALGCAPPAHELRSFDDRDWVRASREQFEPIAVGERLLITPSWHARGDTDAGRTAIVLDPGLAFGTGSHPTTRMCLEWLDRNLRAGDTVIDYGCGSGILAIAAARLGASRVVAIDIDEQALASTRANAAVNQVVLDVRASSEPPPEPARVVVANILAMPLKLLAPLLWSLVAPGGSLVLAGLLERQVADVAAAYPDASMQVADTREGWACLAARKA